MRQLYFTILFCLVFGLNTNAQFYCKHNHLAGDGKVWESSSNADSLDVLHYTISINNFDFTAQEIVANTSIRFTPRTNGNQEIRFDLLELTVDSVFIDGAAATFSYDDTTLIVQLPSAANVGDTSSCLVYYHGAPVADAQNQGGFYFDGAYAYNIGVALNDQPHNGGKYWFPCFDNFTDRSSYSFYITTSGGKKAHCNGHMVSETTLGGDTIVRNWELLEEIPTYLACVAVSDYTVIHDVYTGQNGVIPVELVAWPNDTADLRASFQNLDEAFHIYERLFGSYQWNKIGYSIVPFPYGAMEHATNVAYQSALVNGFTSYETVMAHELAHSWWGNDLTCERAEEMWLNEGWASYCEHLFLEELYGRQNYMDAVIGNHIAVIQDGHVDELNYYALDSVPQDFTYGIHTYQKGAMVLHNLRGVLGDSLFYHAMQSIHANESFTSYSSEDFKNWIQLYTGVNMDDFFNGWVEEAGFPNFRVDSFAVSQQGSNYDVSVVVRQMLRAAPQFFNALPIEINFVGANFERFDTTVTIGGEYWDGQLTLDFEPVTIYTNRSNRILGASTADEKVVKNLSLKNYQNTFVSMSSNGLQDSVFMRIQKNWVAPQIENGEMGLRMSTHGFWSIYSNMKPGDHFIANLGYSKDFDGDLVGQTEDSLILVYRANGGEPWVEYPNYTKNTQGSLTDGYGAIVVDSVSNGEYAFANASLSSSIASEVLQDVEIEVYPSILSSNEKAFVKGLDSKQDYALELIDSNGKNCLQMNIKGKSQAEVVMPTDAGIYILKLANHGGELVKSNKLVIVE